MINQEGNEDQSKDVDHEDSKKGEDDDDEDQSKKEPTKDDQSNIDESKSDHSISSNLSSPWLYSGKKRISSFEDKDDPTIIETLEVMIETLYKLKELRSLIKEVKSRNMFDKRNQTHKEKLFAKVSLCWRRFTVRSTDQDL